ncbi:MAG: HSP20 family molecular chaperone IbpA [Arenicella sp.]
MKDRDYKNQTHIIMEVQKNLFKELAEEAMIASLMGGGIAQSNVEFERTEEGFIMKVQTPSLNESNYHLQVNMGNLMLYTVFNKPEGASIHEELPKGSVQPTFVRNFPISPKVDKSKIEAVYDEGMLKILLPFLPEEKLKPRNIDIKKYYS